MDLFVSNNRVHHLVSIAYNTIVIRSIPKEKTQNRTDIWKLPIHGDWEVQVWESVSVCSRNEGVEEVLIMLFFMCNKQPNACFFFSEGI